MNFNQFYVYSAISVTENQNSSDLLKIVEIAEKFHSFNNSDEVKDYLKEQWNIKNDVQNFSVGSNAKISTKSKSENFIVTFRQDNRISTYRYNN